RPGGRGGHAGARHRGARRPGPAGQDRGRRARRRARLRDRRAGGRRRRRGHRPPRRRGGHDPVPDRRGGRRAPPPRRRRLRRLRDHAGRAGRPRRPRVRPAVSRAAPRTDRRAAARPPWALVPLAALAVGFLVLPLVALLQRAPWSDLTELVRRPIVTDALRLSLVSAAVATGLSLLGGVPLAWVLARSRLPGLSVLRALATLPVVLPPVVGGAALLFAFGRRGLVGEPLEDATGFVLPFSIWGVIAANTFVALPFLVLTVESGLRAVDTRYEEAAATLGAGRWTVLRRGTLPQAAPSIVAGAVLGFARALRG